MVCFSFLLNNFRNDCVLQTIFMPKSDATRSVWCAFENYVVLTACVLANELPLQRSDRGGSPAENYFSKFIHLWLSDRAYNSILYSFWLRSEKIF